MDVIVLGGGLMGTSAAFFLARRGIAVTLIDPNAIGAGATTASFGNIRRTGRFLPQMPLAHRSRALWAQTETLLGRDVEFRATGHVRLIFDEESRADMRRFADAAAPWGLTLEELNATELRRRFPGLGQDAIGASFSPNDGSANPRLVAPAFAENFRCVIPDLRGYGRSSVPEPDPEHEAYSKRTMAADFVSLMAGLGFDRFHVLGHDRGARVAYRLALDHSERVERLGIIEVIPTGDMWARFNAAMAVKTYHWSFLAQPHPLPEQLIEGDPGFYLHWTLKSWTRCGSLEPFHPDALGEYHLAFSEPERIRACCEDYRAGWHLDGKRDEEDRAAGRRIQAPIHYVWSDRGFPAKAAADSLDFWRAWGDRVTGQPIESGHFAQEENPKAVIEAFLPFFKAQD